MTTTSDSSTKPTGQPNIHRNWLGELTVDLLTDDIRGTRVYIWARIVAPAPHAHIAGGDLAIDGEDVGDAPKGFWGSSGYEYGIMVKREHRARIIDELRREVGGVYPVPSTEEDEQRLLLKLVWQKWAGNPRAITAAKQWCEERGIETEWWSWISMD